MRKIYNNTLTSEISECILHKNYTIRQTANYLGMSKSKIHNFIHTYIRYNFNNTYNKICKILNIHFKNKHINGGYATKKRWERIKNNA